VSSYTTQTVQIGHFLATWAAEKGRLSPSVQGFDTIYHEHFSYFSLITVDQLARRHGLRVFDVEELPTHGGSLRV
jgi:hypothetical protein